MNWKPGIGDPSLIGWLAVMGYFITAGLCAWVAVRLGRGTGGPQRRSWAILALVLVVLGINREMDLQGLLLAWGRSFAYEQGIFENRRALQMIFLGLLAVVALTALFLSYWMNRHHWREQGWMLVGSVFLVTFVLLRASSFHHFQDFLAFPLGGVRLHRIIELFAIAWLAGSALKRLRELRLVPESTPRIAGGAGRDRRSVACAGTLLHVGGSSGDCSGRNRIPGLVFLAGKA